MSIDLRKDAAEIRKLLVRTVERYAEKNASLDSARDYPPLTRFDFTFDLGDGTSKPFLMVQLDTEPGSEPTGDYSHAEFETLDRPGWRPVVNAACEGEDIRIVSADGKTVVANDANLEKVIGEFLVSMLLSAKNEEVFNELPKDRRCEIGVESSGGGFGWPKYDDRGRENLI